MNQYKVRHHFRLDETTEKGLEAISKYTQATKSSIMRRYIQECVSRDVVLYAQQNEKTLNLTKTICKKSK